MLKFKMLKHLSDCNIKKHAYIYTANFIDIFVKNNNSYFSRIIKEV